MRRGGSGQKEYLGVEQIPSDFFDIRSLGLEVEIDVFVQDSSREQVPVARDNCAYSSK